MQVRAVILAAVLMLVPLSARAENVIRWATTLSPTGFDPHGYDNVQTWTVQHQVFESLLCYSWEYRAEPCLAVSWKLVEPYMWEFRLREGVHFHDGATFTSADVVFTIERARDEHSTVRRAGSVCLDRFSGLIGGVSAGFRRPRSAAAE